MIDFTPSAAHRGAKSADAKALQASIPFLHPHARTHQFLTRWTSKPSIDTSAKLRELQAMSDEGIEAQRAKAGFWFSEELSPGVKIEMNLKSMLCSTSSPYQKIDVIETSFGRTLVTDGKTQSAEFDEFAYHESLVHPPLLRSALLSNGGSSGPRSVFIGGGGELATAREVLRHGSVERVVMVDLDEKIIDVCKEFLPEWGGESVSSDPRLELIVGDAHAYLTGTSEKFDAIIMDISDPIEAGPGVMLYTREFYEHARTLLNGPNGVFVTQAGCADSVPSPRAAGGREHNVSCFGPIKNTLGTIFDCVVPYSTNIPSFGGDWGFVMAFNAPNGSGVLTAEARDELVLEWTDASKHVIDRLIEQHITDIGHGGRDNGGCDDVLRFYDGITHNRMFSLTKPLRNFLKRDKRIMTKDDPIFMF